MSLPILATNIRLSRTSVVFAYPASSSSPHRFGLCTKSYLYRFKNLCLLNLILNLINWRGICLLCGNGQVLALVYYCISYFPGGSSGMRFLSSALTSSVLRVFGR